MCVCICVCACVRVCVTHTHCVCVCVRPRASVLIRACLRACVSVCARVCACFCVYRSCPAPPLRKRRSTGRTGGYYADTVLCWASLDGVFDTPHQLAYTRYSFTCLCVCKNQPSLYYPHPFPLPT